MSIVLKSFKCPLYGSVVVVRADLLCYVWRDMNTPMYYSVFMPGAHMTHSMDTYII